MSVITKNINNNQKIKNQESKIFPFINSANQKLYLIVKTVSVKNSWNNPWKRL